MKTLLIASFALCALSLYAVADDADTQRVKEDAVGASGAITNAIKHSAEMATFCSENPDDAKCVRRRKAAKLKVKDDIEMYNEVRKDPAMRELIDREIAAGRTGGKAGKSERREMLENIRDMCKDPASEACKVAKQDYEDWKTKQ